MDVAKEGRSHRSGASETRDSDLIQACSWKEIHSNKKALGDGRHLSLHSIGKLGGTVEGRHRRARLLAPAPKRACRIHCVCCEIFICKAGS